MGSVAWLQLRKVWQLQYALFLSGLAVSGGKAFLSKSLDQELAKPLFSQDRERILSVDMGIKNLAICLLEAPRPFRPQTAKGVPVDQKLKVIAWQKVDVLRQLNPEPPVEEAPEATKTLSRPEPAPIPAFHPSTMAEVACKLAQSWVKDYTPDTVLIERQRFRSGGAAAVQEWTLRVNMLESMLWASLKTIRDIDHTAPTRAFPALVGVIPARVAQFWCSSPSPDTRVVAPDLLAGGTESKELWNKLESKKIEKKDKIAVVRSWLEPTEDIPPEIQLDFAPEAEQVAGAFLAKTRGGKMGKADKLDDLADCLLQAVAWVKWEENRRAIQTLVEDSSPG